MDVYDKKILLLLQKDNKLSQRDIADRINLSSSAVNRRIIALNESGIIKSNVSIVEGHKVGRPITIITQIRVENERLDLLEDDKKRFVNCPQVQQVYYTTGDCDFILVINVKDMEEYEKITRELFFSSGNIKSFHTYVSMQNAKQNAFIVIE